MAFGKQPMDTEVTVNLATQLYKYQNYKSSAAVKNIDCSAYQDSSIIAFHSLLRKYITTGQKDLQRANDTFYNTIDSLREKHYTILRPSEQDQARPYTLHSRKTKSVVKTSTDNSVKPVSKDPQKLNISADTMEKVKQCMDKSVIGVQVEDSIKLFDNEDVMKGFISAFSYMENPPKFRKVKVTITEV